MTQECKEGKHIWVTAFPEEKVYPNKDSTWFYCIKCYKRKG